ncbi:helix-turn-helix domain-containing protein [Thermus thermophilus]|uniref:Transcriptional regulator n=1 Tax=Thermus thermophilus TaxID=274 RepID=A0AAD1NXT8_THETH|nr:helix-turn-helix domain-containing protein [Thermus thermophilus]BCZ86574.1 transcriptional regulator [Thermus thermophilus]
MLAISRTLRTWAQAMALHYAREIPDYGRLDEVLLSHDVAFVSYEYLRALLEGELDLDAFAFSVGQRRQRQGVSLSALLRAYRLWAKDTLTALGEELPDHLPGLAPRVAELLDRVSEASAQGFQRALEGLDGLFSRPPLTGVGATLKNAQGLALAPRYLSLPKERMAFLQTTMGPLLFVSLPLEQVEGDLRTLARSCGAVLWAAEGKNLREVQVDLEEALLLGDQLALPPGIYRVHLLWPLASALESPRFRDRLLRLLAPLEAYPDLLRTLEIHLDSRLSLKRTARRLSLHPNTVLYRLHRLEALTGLRLDRLEDLCLLTMALQLKRVLEGKGQLPQDLSPPKD